VSDPHLADELAFALSLADLADSISLPVYAGRDFDVDWKANKTEVTEADRRAEQALRERVSTERPHHAFVGEEYGTTGSPDAEWRWVVDPIDGTSNFARGIPVWASLIALVHGDEPVVGVVSAPGMGHRWWAARGLGAFADGRPIAVSTIDRLQEAQVSVTFSAGWDALGLTGELVALQQRAYRARGFGDFWQHMLVAEGAVDLAIDAVGLAPYDVAAVMVVVEEAGGTFTDRHGERTYLHDTAITSNGLLHSHAIDALH
jgi:histidinol-phosphatase